METCFSSGEKKKKCIHKTIKSNYLNEDFWLADSNYFDLKEMHLFFFFIRNDLPLRCSSFSPV